MEDKVKAKIQELCPDVMELKFGCEVKDHGIYIAKTPDDDEYYFAPLKEDVNGEAQVFCVNSIEGAEILGSPITLAVVLRAINTIRVDCAVSASGEFLQYIHNSGTGYHFTSMFWNLSLDNYDQQSPECKAFIGTLLEVM